MYQSSPMPVSVAACDGFPGSAVACAISPSANDGRRRISVSPDGDRRVGCADTFCVIQFLVIAASCSAAIKRLVRTARRIQRAANHELRAEASKSRRRLPFLVLGRTQARQRLTARPSEQIVSLLL